MDSVASSSSSTSTSITSSTLSPSPSFVSPKIINSLAKYEDVIKIADVTTKKTATVSIFVKKFPHKFDNQEMITVFMTVFTEALLLSQSNNVQFYDVLVDCKGTTRKNLNKKFCKDLISIMKSTFNNTLGRCVIFNTNQLFRTLYSLFTSLIDKPTKEKIKVF